MQLIGHRGNSFEEMIVSQNEVDPDVIQVYTDGGCINNPGLGGYAAIILMDGKCQDLVGGFRLTTNNRMEIMAAIVALRQVRHSKRSIQLYSDSSYLVNGIEKGWAKRWQSKGWRKADGKMALNIDLWQELLNLLDDKTVRFNWVKGHAGNKFNERCDTLAGLAARESSLPADTGYETETSTGKRAL